MDHQEELKVVTSVLWKSGKPMHPCTGERPQQTLGAPHGDACFWVFHSFQRNSVQPPRSQWVITTAVWLSDLHQSIAEAWVQISALKVSCVTFSKLLNFFLSLSLLIYKTISKSSYLKGLL